METTVNEAKAIHRYARISPTKVRQVINLIRGKDVGVALAILQELNKRAARIVEKLLKSAIANAENKGMDIDNLYIKEIKADDGPMLKRYMPRAYGRATMIRRRYSHITIKLAERQ
ncbi:50S ribosomal protein L22 [Hydrogenothermus marinus]|uniref:Large ribosomal subunit protein uL22 n=1 Tax=Hydrogenothermus marinus TaxID=133270 RepID=A0A3M0B5I9_9AQUI|nr:50S ribosomal protein L22 [Hydrogenothermus marinus]RMA92441.1 large subunit ribosomal protein L22 [Hydrogenothermus marinus]